MNGLRKVRLNFLRSQQTEEVRNPLFWVRQQGIAPCRWRVFIVALLFLSGLFRRAFSAPRRSKYGTT